MTNITCQPAGDTAIRVTFHEKVSPELNRNIKSFCKKLKEQAVKGVIEWVPAYHSVIVYYHPYHISYENLRDILLNLANKDLQLDEESSTLVKIPVLYGGKIGPDIVQVAENSGLSEQNVIEKHSSVDYLIYMIGFLPGFPYLGGLPETLATPRLNNPRSHVPEGSIGIAGNQTGIYPLASPGGWNLIGKTPVQLFNPDREEPFLYRAGDRIRFVPISKRDYDKIKKQVVHNTFQIEKEVIG
ncbi:inhibitor of KinA [Lentibacillus halodurans]|uniref:Inhibitor of KinA n=1 Tax=Lentibacillus halodurans TaxID=237679 RepID=A0A1I0XMV3_9BACI|nr:5-oxoprolinase subunit PxpB [Lentibacillus halodurans]SFB02331.1 inhibitor of KinA [Lentibacillus halodurans]